jgi:hypothetical protein
MIIWHSAPEKALDQHYAVEGRRKSQMEKMTGIDERQSTYPKLFEWLETLSGDCLLEETADANAESWLSPGN